MTWSVASFWTCASTASSSASIQAEDNRASSGNDVVVSAFIGFVSNKEASMTTSIAQMEANRRNALRSTGPRTAEGKVRSAQNAVKHGFTGRLLVGLKYGPFADDSEDLQGFVNDVLEELAPRSAQEHAEALNIIGLYVRRARLVELEAMALAHGTRAPLLPPARPGQPARVKENDLMRAGAEALSSDLFDKLPRYEGHLGKELDRSLARYARLQEARRQQESAVVGEVVRLGATSAF